MTEEDLVARYLETRDPPLFAELVERSAPRVLRLVSSILGPHRNGEAEETVQDVFLRAHERLWQFRGASQFATWLYRLAYNVAVQRAQRARLRLPHVPADALASLAAACDPQAEVIEGERAEAVARAVESLPDVYRTVVFLHYWQDASIDEIAEMLATPVNTIKSYLHRARQRLGRELEKRGVTR